MMFIIFGDRSDAALDSFEQSGRRPKPREREKLERDLNELEAAAARVRAALAEPVKKARAKC